MLVATQLVATQLVATQLVALIPSVRDLERRLPILLLEVEPARKEGAS